MEAIMPTATSPNLGAVDGVRMRSLREARGWTQQDLAGEAGLAMSTVTKVEQRGSCIVQSDVLAKLARALDVRVDDLLVRV